MPLDLGALRALRASALVVGELVDTLRTPPTLAETAHDDGGINVARRVIRPQVIGEPCGLELTRPKDLQRWAGLAGTDLLRLASGWIYRDRFHRAMACPRRHRREAEPFSEDPDREDHDDDKDQRGDCDHAAIHVPSPGLVLMIATS